MPPGPAGCAGCAGVAVRVATGCDGAPAVPVIEPPPALPDWAACAWFTLVLALPTTVPLCAPAGAVARPAMIKAVATTAPRFVKVALMTRRPPPPAARHRRRSPR